MSVPLGAVPLPPWFIIAAAGAAASLLIAPSLERKRATKGLPKRENLKRLVATYLTEQHRLWPDRIGSDLLPKQSDEQIVAFAEQFEGLFTGRLAFDLDRLAEGASAVSFAAAYVRYSDDNSDPASLDQQLVNILRKGRERDLFIPFPLVFADAGVTGRHADRQGYQLLKQAIAVCPASLEAVIFDDISRSNRYCVEALKLGELVEQRKRLLLGATDGFDSSTEMSKLILSVGGSLTEHFSVQLAQKVRRGMRHAFSGKDVIGKIPVGYKAIEKLDAAGRAVLRKNGLPKRELAIDEVTGVWVRQVFEWYVNDRQKLRQIYRQLNLHAVDGSKKWSGDKVRKLLKRSIYVGVRTYNKTEHVVDRQTGKVTERPRPKSEWMRVEVPDLRIVSDELFEKAQQLLGEVAEAHRRQPGESTPRPDVAPSGLIPLTCGYCGARLTTACGAKYRSFWCPNGHQGKVDCKLDSSKSNRIIEKAIFDFVVQHLMTEAVVAEVVREANAFIREKAAEPPVDLAPLKAEQKSLSRKIGRLVDQLEDADEASLPEVSRRLKKRQGELKRCVESIRKAEASQQQPPKEVTTEEVTALLGDLPGLLSDDVAAVAPIVARMLGPVTITQQRQEGKRGAIWHARFSFSHTPVLLALAKRRGCPTARTLEYLSACDWITPHSVLELAGFSGGMTTISIDRVPAYERLAPIVGPRHAEGASPAALAVKYEVSANTIHDAVRFYRDGDRPKYKPRRKDDEARQQSARPMVFKTIAPEVARRVDRGETAKDIADDLNVSTATVSRAYDYARPRDAADAASEGRRIRRSKRYSKFTPELKKQIVQMHFDGRSFTEIEATLRVSVSSIGRIVREAYEAADEETKKLFPHRPTRGTYHRVCELTEEGLDANEIAAELSLHVSGIHGHLRRWRQVNPNW